MLAFGSGAAVAADGLKKVEVNYRNIKIFVNGRPINSPVEPFILVEKKSTMVPIRLVAENLGSEVLWDEASSSIYIREKLSPSVNDSRVVFVPLEELKVLRRVGGFYRPEKGLFIAGRGFESGLAVEVDKGEGKQLVETVLDLNGRFKRLDGFLGVEDQTMNSSGAFTLKVLADEQEIFHSQPLKPSQYPSYLSLEVPGVKRLTLVMDWQKAGFGEYSKILAGLANFRLYP